MSPTCFTSWRPGARSRTRGGGALAKWKVSSPADDICNPPSASLGSRSIRSQTAILLIRVLQLAGRAARAASGTLWRSAISIFLLLLRPLAKKAEFSGMRTCTQTCTLYKGGGCVRVCVCACRGPADSGWWTTFTRFVEQQCHLAAHLRIAPPKDVYVI